MAPRIEHSRWLVLAAVAAIVVSACGGTSTTPPPATAPPVPTTAVTQPPVATQPPTVTQAPATSEATVAATAPASAPATGVATPAVTLPPLGTPVTGLNCAAGATEVKFWSSHTPPDSDSIANIVNAFNAANPDICVKLTLVIGSETDVAQLVTAMHGGAAPDIYEADRFTVPERAANQVLAALPDSAVALKDNYLTFAWNETQFQGKTYALPFDTDARALFYNKDMLTAAGVDAATMTKLDNGLKNNAPITWDELATIAAKVTKTDSSGNYTQLGYYPYQGPNGNATQAWHYTYGFSFGGSFADIAGCKVTPTDPGVVAGFQWLHDYVKTIDPDKLQRFSSTNYPPNYPTSQDPFLNGKVGMVITGDWNFANFAKYVPNTHFGFTLIPVPKAGDTSATWAGGWSLALIPGSQHPDQALKFMEYMTGKDGEATYVKETTHLPTWKSLLTDTTLYDPNHAQFLGLLAGAKNRPPLPVGAEYWDALTTAQDSVVQSPQADPMPALQAVADKVNPDLQQFCPLT
jgi:multiple sugar transport system substrate-binding protein